MELPGEDKAIYLSDYMGRLKSARYSQIFRLDILKQAVARYSGMLNAHMEGKKLCIEAKNG